jgi:hypothetical protein
MTEKYQMNKHRKNLGKGVSAPIATDIFAVFIQPRYFYA